MTLSKQLVDGQQPLDAQERALNFLEQVTFAKVISYAKSTDNVPSDITPNETVLQDVPIGAQPGALRLAALDVGSDVVPTITQQLQQGKIVIFHDVAFVSGKAQTVLGFR